MTLMTSKKPHLPLPHRILTKPKLFANRPKADSYAPTIKPLSSSDDRDIYFVSRCRVQVARELFNFFRIMITLLRWKTCTRRIHRTMTAKQT